MTTGDLSALRSAAGEDALEEHEPVAVDGVAIGATLRPPDVEALARALAALSAVRVGALVRGGGSRLGLGNPPRSAQLFLSTQHLSGVDVFEPGEGVCHAGAGTPLAELREKVAAEGWELPLDPPGAGSTLGGAIASAAPGPRVQGFGPVRDAVLGLEVVLASGERTRCGGRVVKNVTGYDLGKLYTGSLGTLGVLEGAWLRLRPLPERVQLLEASLAPERAYQAGLDAARRVTLRAAALVLRGEAEAEARLVVELAGDAPAVERDAAALCSACPAREAEPRALEEVRALQGSLGQGELRFRLAVLPSRLASVVARLRGAGAELVVYPGATLVYAGLGVADEAAASRAIALAAETARDAGGGFVLEEAPPWAKRARDVFGADEPSRALARALKERFDPHGILNAGRFQGFV